MDRPLLIINLKTYREGSGPRALYLAHVASRVAREERVRIALAAQATDIFKLSTMADAPVFSQHVDSLPFGANTGAVLPEAVKQAGAVGTVINHAERRLADGRFEATVARCKEAGLETVVCAATLDEARHAAAAQPAYVAFEAPDLIGTLQSVSRLRSESVREFAAAVDGKSVPLCGAGLATGDDLRVAIELGMRGGIVATAVVKAADPEAVLREMARALRGE